MSQFAVEWREVCTPRRDMNTSYFNHSGYGPLPFWDNLTNPTAFNNRDFVNPFQVDEDRQGPLPPSTLGLATGALFILSCGTGKSLIKSKWIVWTVAILSVLVLALPVISTLLIYKMLVKLCVRGKTLAGADVLWAVDADESCSLAVINVLAVVSGDLSLQQLKTVVAEKLVPCHEKLKHLRQYSPLGYFFWKGQQKLNLDDYIKTIDCDFDEVVTEEELRETLSTLSNAPLPLNHLAGWEIYLGPKLMYSGKMHRAVIFRIHHSMGDGPALFRALLSTLANSGDMHVLRPNPETIKKMVDRVQTRNQNSFLDNIVTVGRSLKSQFLLAPDQNKLHGPKLTGKKQIAWCSSRQLMEAAKSIHTATGASFSAGLLASFLAAVAKYSKNSDKLKSCTVVIPVRIPTKNFNPEDVPEMTNSFSLAVVGNKIPAMEEEDVVAQVRAAEQALKNATNPAVLVTNNFIIKLVGDICPRPLAAVAFDSKECTVAMSNMPGPQKKISLFDLPLEKLVFWVPNKGTTGVGASILSYNGELSLGLNIDNALLDRPEEAQKLALLWKEQLLFMADVIESELCN
ncbi:uncharacterized protein LOC132201959 [Neocloeon triangulifer]|uniref:uncharacterized protein LOC132201959 n=1 Tax=Neocloeon triangulifer TaxID=2078957 RepID=UPI00286ECFD0|nr:uncharacterized protein LOC132201959 [Neocloeon triangulifer]